MKRDKRVTVLFSDKEYQHLMRRAQLEQRSLSAHVWLMYRRGVEASALEEGQEEVNEASTVPEVLRDLD